jgi:signal transduction histidine kinase
VAGDANALTPIAWTTLYRITQEALTNARRRGQAHQVDVRLSLDGSAHLLVEDDGMTKAATVVTAGNGLTGMAERVERLGGSLGYGPRLGGGFRVEVTLPL